MEAKDFRLGNLIFCESLNKPIKVTPTEIECAVGMEGHFKLTFKPIPLTEEILLKCGYEINFLDFKHFYKLHNLYLDANFQPIDTFITYDLKYLHQLQNLYFALTNEELTINL